MQNSMLVQLFYDIHRLLQGQWNHHWTHYLMCLCLSLHHWWSFVKITLSGSAERPALSSMKAKFSTLDLPASTYLAALISGFDPSDPSWVNSPLGPMSNRWSQQANDNALEYFSSFCGLTTLERNVTASSQAVLPSYVSHEAEHLIDEWELKSCGS